MNKLIFVLLLAVQSAYAGQFDFEKVENVPVASFRGLSVVDGRVAWVSGSKGWIGRSSDGGRHWSFKKVRAFEQSDFRSIYAFDSLNAVIANAGAPAFILRTNDGGTSWKVVYRNDDTAAFFDGIDFRNNREGIIYGDPLSGRMMILRTTDGGHTWMDLPGPKRPALIPGEASFAASGTNVRYIYDGTLVIATGGKVSSLFVSTDNGMNWVRRRTPIIQGLNSTGIFSVDFLTRSIGIIVGGDYKRDSLSTDHVFLTRDGGKTWRAPITPTRGYRECVTYICLRTLIATGPGGTDISEDGGDNWKPLSDEKGFHVIRRSRSGNLIVMAGAGKIMVSRFKQMVCW